MKVKNNFKLYIIHLNINFLDQLLSFFFIIVTFFNFFNIQLWRRIFQLNRLLHLLYHDRKNIQDFLHIKFQILHIYN